ncbi:DUF4235 domain-containing protein [Pengzhenrongella frigida]|uniref:DUF4235 domain-containing protein n=1 Tax=Pengzhenrongella frigida TaxID=1259133 RepID=UPI001F5C0ADE|nr:DUF4235 domain-containing protein [Cellulomonas sp. HLT2-17]
MAKLDQSTKSKLIGTAVALVGAMAVQKAVSFVWTAMSGHRPPPDDDTSAGLGEIAAAAVITGAAMALVRVLAVRGARRAID